jgi:uncharacterized NAD(P)/FAD-binding protein YdhS
LGSITIIEPRARLGLGLAYSTHFSQHLLNVPADKMSLYPDRPGHFIDWLRASGWNSASPSAFVPRWLYGQYIESELLAAAESGRGQFRHVHDEAIEVRPECEGYRVQVRQHSSLIAGRVVLALGNPASAPILSPSVNASHRWHVSPWMGDALRVRRPGEKVLVVGTGLTAIDCVLALHSNELQCSTVMISRRGLLSQVHDMTAAAVAPPSITNPPRINTLLRQVRAEIRNLESSGGSWRSVLDSLRPASNDIWRQLPEADQRRFLRHLRPYWENHRHRMAPEIGKRLEILESEGRNTVIAGRLRVVEETDSCIQIRVARRNAADELIEVARAINCTGIHEDFHDSPRALIRSLVDNGIAAVNSAGTGFRTDSNGGVYNNRGICSDHIFAIGPVRRGQLFETTAVPEIRVQAEHLAKHLIQSSTRSLRLKGGD